MTIQQNTQKSFPMPNPGDVSDISSVRRFSTDLVRELGEFIRKVYDDIDALFDNPSFSVHKSGTDQTGVATATWTKLTWSTEEFDSHGQFASNKFTPLVQGRYQLSAAVQFTTSTTPVEIAIYKNGAIYKEVLGGSISCLVDADGIDDYFEVYVKQSSGGDKIVDGPAELTWFQGSRLPVVGR